MDYLLNATEFEPVIDQEQIAMSGHSFGGFTALGRCGTIPTYHDKRIKAVLLYSSSASGILYKADELRQVTPPALLFIGESEKRGQFGLHSKQEIADNLLKNIPSSKLLLEIKGANHQSFNTTPNDEADAHKMACLKVIKEYSESFLDRYVKGSTEAQDEASLCDPFITKVTRKDAQTI